MDEISQESTPVQAQSAGEMLTAARQRLNLSAADVARQLRFNARQVDALEANEFHKLPGNAIVRGFIRNYARLLQVPPEPILAAYEAQVPGVHSPAHNAYATEPLAPPKNRKWGRWIVALLVVMLFIGVPVLIYAWLSGDTEFAPVARHFPQRSAAPPSAASLTVPAPVPANPTPTNAAPQSPTASAQAAPTGESPSGEPTVAPALGHVVFKFETPSWISVKDKNGKALVDKTGGLDGEEVVEGLPPLSVVVGNASGVSILYNGKTVDLAPYTKGQVAHLTLE